MSGKTALVLSGGGIPGYMYEIGVLTALDDFFADGYSVNQFDIFVGTSAGAAVAALMANLVPPREIYDAVVRDRPSVFNFKRNDIVSFGTQETMFMLKKFARSFFPMLAYYWRNRRRFTLIDFLMILQENLPSGIFTLANFERYLANFFQREGYTDDFRRLKRELYIPAVDIDRGDFDVFGEPGFEDVPISRAVVASSALPIWFQPVTVKGREYVDGGVGRVIYLHSALDQGAQLVLVVNPVQYILNDRSRVCLTSFSGACAGIKDKGLTYLFDQAQRINTCTRIHLAISHFQNKYLDRDFLIIEPSPTEAHRLLYNVINLRARLEVIQYGYSSTVQLLTESFPKFQAVFARHGIKVTLDRFKERVHQKAGA